MGDRAGRHAPAPPVPADHDVSGLPRTLASAALGAALTPLNSTMVAVALPALTGEFGVEPSRVTLTVVTGYLAATLAVQIPAGRMADRIGYARALTWGRVMFASGSVLATLAPWLSFVILGRLLMAAGGALIVPTAMALIRVTVGADKRARAFGTMGAVMSGAAAIGPALGAWIVATFGWRALFVVNVPLLTASWLLQPPVPASEPAGSTPAAARRLDLTLLRNGGFLAGAGVIATQNLAMYSLLFQVPFLFGAEPRLGLAIIAMTATMALSSPFGGWLADRAGARVMVVIAGLIGVAGVIGLSRLPSTAGLPAISGWLLLVGLAIGLSSGPAQATAMGSVPPEHSAIAAAMSAMFRYLGGVAGTAILGVALGAGHDGGASHHLALWIFAGAFAVSALLGCTFPARTYDRAGAG